MVNFKAAIGLISLQPSIAKGRQMRVASCTVEPTEIIKGRPMSVKATLVKHSLGHMYYVVSVMSIEGESQNIELQLNQVEALNELLGIIMRGAPHDEQMEAAPIHKFLRGLING